MLPRSDMWYNRVCGSSAQAHWRPEGSAQLTCSAYPFPDECAPATSASQTLRG